MVYSTNYYTYPRSLRLLATIRNRTAMLCFFVVWLAVESVEARIDTPGKSKMEPENGPKTSFLHQPAVFRFHVGFFQRVDQAFMFIRFLGRLLTRSGSSNVFARNDGVDHWCVSWVSVGHWFRPSKGLSKGLSCRGVKRIPCKPFRWKTKSPTWVRHRRSRVHAQNPGPD